MHFEVRAHEGIYYYLFKISLYVLLRFCERSVMAGDGAHVCSVSEESLNESEQLQSDSGDDECHSDAEILNENILETFREELKQLPELCKYISKLHSFVKNQHRKIKRLLEKAIQKGQVKGDVKKQDVGVQTDFELDNLEKLDKEWQESKNIEDSKRKWKDNEAEVSTTVAEQVKEAAESAMQQTGFVYEETSGMYYDYNTGYYYNAELGLYYDGNTGTYYYYNEQDNTFQYHSQIEQKSVEMELHKSRPRKKERHKKQEPERRKRKAEELLEEGECSDTSEDSEISSEDENNSDDTSTEQGKAWPPCMRIIVKESSSVHLKVGTLFIVPYTGGTVGREGDHVFCLPDINISKSHFKLQFSEKDNKFFVEDLGSRNGTILNGQRLEEGAEGHQEVMHGSILQLGTLKLLCHIHAGRDATCGHCEPGLVQQNTNTTCISASEDKSVVGNKGDLHRKELKRLKKKFGLESSEPVKSAISVPGYEDRAQLRREKVGSQNPYEKTEVASVDEHITPKNKGFQLLKRMGWSQGQSLGKDGDGCIEPVKVTATLGKAGLGSEPCVAAVASATAASNVGGASTRASEERTERWRRTQQRFKELD